VLCCVTVLSFVPFSPLPSAFAGQGTDEDIVVSSARAYVAALNKLVAWRAKQQPQQQQQAEAEAEVAPAVPEAVKGSKKKAGKGQSGRLVAAR
jgi:hypothetical protein